LTKSVHVLPSILLSRDQRTSGKKEVLEEDLRAKVKRRSEDNDGLERRELHALTLIVQQADPLNCHDQS